MHMMTICVKCIWSAGKTNVTKLLLTDKGQLCCFVLLCARAKYVPKVAFEGDLVHCASRADPYVFDTYEDHMCQ
jgi:hypothetical protein